MSQKIVIRLVEEKWTPEPEADGIRQRRAHELELERRGAANDPMILTMLTKRFRGIGEGVQAVDSIRAELMVIKVTPDGYDNLRPRLAEVVRQAVQDMQDYREGNMVSPASKRAR